MSWPLRATAGEALRGRRRFLLWLTAVFALTLAAAVVGEVVAADTLWQAEARRQEAGGDVLQVRYDQGSTVRDVACEQFSRWPSVQAAGLIGVSNDERVGAARYPDANIEVFEATPEGLEVVVGHRVDSTGLVVGQALAEELGLDVGEQVVLDGTISTVGAVVNTAPRFPEFGRVVFHAAATVVSPRRCLVETAPHQTEHVRRAMAAVGVARDVGAEVSPLVTTGSQDAVAAHRNRITRFGWAFVGTLTALTALVLMALTRASAGLYLSLGMSRADMVLMTMCQVAMVVGPVVILCSLILRAVIPFTAVQTVDALWWSVTRLAVAAGLTALVLVPLAVLVVVRHPVGRLVQTRL